MRIRMLQRPNAASIDGLRVDGFKPGQQYEVGHTLAELFLAEGWAEPVDENAAVASGHPGDAGAATTRTAAVNVTKVFFPPDEIRTARAADRPGRRNRRRK
jgi:hypothetical protein